ncbi:MAG TPA: hypothetical protein VFS20_02225 [Longimicrobium sp.]|nr:hypothetical protein [Longimicrobium sp.]
MTIDFTFEERTARTPPPRRLYGVTDVTPYDMAEILTAIEDTINTCILHVYGIRNGGMRLALARVSYQSPLEISSYVTSFREWAVGRGELLEKLTRALFDRVILFEAERSKRDADAAYRWAEVKKLELENIQFILELAKEYDLDRSDVEVLLRSIHRLTDTRLKLRRVAVNLEGKGLDE